MSQHHKSSWNYELKTDPIVSEVMQPIMEGEYFNKNYVFDLNDFRDDCAERNDDDDESALHCQPTWRLKERMKTTGVCMILALNVGTDPPDVSKPNPCAKLLCWLDPTGMSRAKARDIIGERLEEQYAKWQQRGKLRYKRALDPTVEETRNLCLTMRRHAKNERLLLHFNGHGVPRPTEAAEIWVFDKGHTQYIPLSVQKLRHWIGGPTIVVLDCSNAGVLIPAFVSGSNVHGKVGNQTPEHDFNAQSSSDFRSDRAFKPSHNEFSAAEGINDSSPYVNQNTSSFHDCIVLCPCAKGELLPMSPAYPADLFTSCLTTPIPIALRWFVRQNPLSMDIDPESVDRIPGKISDRKTPLGELNWIFTAVTDTIAWNVLPSTLFQRLFRQDLLVASMLRNFLLADRILRSLNCTPTSYPQLPSTANHPLWQSWDLAVESCLYQLIRDGHLGGSNSLYCNDEKKVYEMSDKSMRSHSPLPMALSKPVSVTVPFFSEQLTAFEVWLDFAGIRNDNSLEPPEELPVVLQVLLSQAHRVRALKLLKRFLDLGAWAVNLALSVGIFPYVLKLLQSPVFEYRHVLVLIWARILCFDTSCQADLVKDKAIPHFINHLSWGMNNQRGEGTIDEESPNAHEDAAIQRMTAAFILSVICLNFSSGQRECLRQNLHLKCGELLGICETNEDENMLHHPVYIRSRMWLCICLGRLCENNTVVQNEVFAKGIHCRLLSRLDDYSPQVGAAAAYALGLLIRVAKKRTSSSSLSGSASMTSINSKDPQSYRMNDIPQEVMYPDRHRIHSDTLIAHRLSKEWSAGSPLFRCEVLLALGCLIEKYSMAFASICCQKNQSTSHFCSIPMPHVFDSEQSSMLYDVWDVLLKFTNDPYPQISNIAFTIHDFVHTLVRRIERQNNTNEFQDGHLKEQTSPIPLTPLNEIVDNENNSSTKMPSTVRRNVSDYFTRWTSQKIENDSENFNTSNHSNVGRQMRYVYSIPMSCFGQRQHSNFGKVDRSDENDFVSKAGAIKSYRLKRNNIAHKYALKLMRKFEELSPSVQDVRRPKLSGNDSFANESPPLLKYERRIQNIKRKLTFKQCALIKNEDGATASFLRFHSYEPVLATCDENSRIYLYDYEQRYNHLACKHVCKNNPSTRVTTMRWINEQSSSLLLTGADNGVVNLWDKVLESNGYIHQNESKIAAAFNAAPDMINNTRGSGLVTEWQQENGNLLVGGDSPLLRCWDLNREHLVSSFESITDSCMTAMTRGWDPLYLDDSKNIGRTGIGPNIFVSGFGNGSMKVFDIRSNKKAIESTAQRRKPRLMKYSEHSSWIVNLFFTGFGGNYEVMSGCVAGYIKVWDLRYPLSCRTIDVQRSQMTALAGHNRVPIFASGSHTQYIKLSSFDGDTNQVIRTHENEGTLVSDGQRIGPISCLDFHPCNLMMAAGATDEIISVYSTNNKNK